MPEVSMSAYPYEDRNSAHRLKADEAYQIGEEGHPVRAYLSVEEIVGAARACGADAIHPGYGFLSENPDLAAACEQTGITFVGPPGVHPGVDGQQGPRDRVGEGRGIHSGRGVADDDAG